MVTWWLNRRRPGVPVLAQVADVGRFLFATLFDAVSAGIIAGLAVRVAAGDGFGSSVRTVTLAHAAGIVLIAPLALVHRRARRSAVCAIAAG